jgi:glycosyltransferase involved in cell wall biosynthesis
MKPIPAIKIPVLMITWNRLEYTKQALPALIESEGVLPVIIDNGSTDGTVEWLRGLTYETDKRPMLLFNSENKGIAGAMNQFLNLPVISSHVILGKVDNDTIVPRDWAMKLKPCLNQCHIVQAKHHIIAATNKKGWDGFVKGKVHKNGLIYNAYVGGSGILFLRSRVDRIPETEWKLGGWIKFQMSRPELSKAFCPDVEIKLLDEHGYTDYPQYYIETGRL